MGNPVGWLCASVILEAPDIGKARRAAVLWAMDKYGWDEARWGITRRVERASVGGPPMFRVTVLNTKEAGKEAVMGRENRRKALRVAGSVWSDGERR